LRLIVGATAACTLTLCVLGWCALVERPAANIANPSRIVTGSAPSHVVLDGMSLDLRPESAVLVSGDTHRGVLVVLDRGTIVLDVEKRAASGGFVVQAGEVRVNVVGTRFLVARGEAGASVEVERGDVEVNARGDSFHLRSGQRWQLAKPPAEVGPFPPPLDTNIAPEPSALSEPVSSARAEVTPPEPVAHEEARAARRQVSAATGHHETLDAAPTGTGKLRAPTQGSLGSYSQELYEAAARLEVSNPARAMALYRQVASQGDSWSADALFAEGRLQSARGNKVEAKRFLTEYVTRYPHGANVEDARLVLARLR
jgi:hypothetical protein